MPVKLQKNFPFFQYMMPTQGVRLSPDQATEIALDPKSLKSFEDYFGVKVMKQGNRAVLIPGDLSGMAAGDEKPTGFMQMWMEEIGALEQAKEIQKEEFRQQRYRYYDFMDLNSTIASTALDTYAGEAVSAGFLESNPVKIKVESRSNEGAEIERRIKKVLQSNNILTEGNTPTTSQATIRTIAKYGDCFFKFSRRHEKAPIMIRKFENPEEVTIDRDLFSKKILGYSYMDAASLYPWECTHMRVPDDNFEPYGRSILEPSRSSYQQLLIVEAMLALTRASRIDRIIIKVPTQQKNATAAFRHISALKSMFKSVIFGTTGATRSDARITALTDIMWFPSGNGYEIDRLASGIDVAGIEDVEFFRDNFITGLRLPKDFLLASDNTQLLGQSLATQDIKFARALLPLQFAYVEGLTRLCTIIAILEGYDPTAFKVRVWMDKPQALTSQMIQDAQSGINLANEVINSFKEATGTQTVTTEQWRKVVSDTTRLPAMVIDALAPKEGEAKEVTKHVYSDSSVIECDSDAVIYGWGLLPEEITREQARQTLLENDPGRRSGLTPLLEVESFGDSSGDPDTGNSFMLENADGGVFDADEETFTDS